MSYDPRQNGAQCDRCVLGEGPCPVPPEFSRKLNPIVLVGEAPGEQEEKYLRPFIGPTGHELDRAMKVIGLRRSECHITNAILCRPAGNKIDRAEREASKRNKAWREKNPDSDEAPPWLSPVDACRPRLLNEIRSVAGETANVIALGGVAYRALTDRRDKPLEIRGGPREEAFGHLLPTLHPSFVMRSRRWTHAFMADLGRAVRWFSSGLAWTDPFTIYRPTPSLLSTWIESEAGSPFVVYDVETAPAFPDVKRYDAMFDPLRVVGLSSHDSKRAIVVPFRSIEDPSKMFYALDEYREIIEIFRRFFASPRHRKVGHNSGYYDRMVIEHHFKVTPVPHLDTIGLHKFVEPELPHSLGYVGSVYTDIHSWKQGKAASNARRDEDLWLYNCIHATTPIVLGDGSTQSISELVARRYMGDVLSFDGNQIVKRRVVGWTRRRENEVRWIAICHDRMDDRSRGLIVTDDHPVWIEGSGFVKADQISPYDRIALPEIDFSDYEKAAIIGTLLGDSTLAASPTRRGSRLSAPRLSLVGGHTTESGLAQFKATVIRDLILDPTQPAGTNASGWRKNEFTPYRTKSKVALANMAELVYDEQDRRRLRVSTLQQIGPVGWAWLFMDDGCRQNGQRRSRNTGARGGRSHDPDSIVIATNGFPREDIDLAVDWMRDEFGSCLSGKDGAIRLGWKASERFCEKIAPHVPDMMRYKFPRHRSFPPFEEYHPVGSKPTIVNVIEVKPYIPIRGSRQRDLRAETKFCLTVDGAHNFFTVHGLVHNSRDCGVTAMSVRPLVQAVTDRDQLKQHAFWPFLQGVCVDLHKIGMYVNQVKRREWDAKLLADARRYHRIISDATGIQDFNPNSTKQLRSLLFEDWDLMPVDYTESGDPSTGDDSLREILAKQNLDVKQRATIINVRLYRRRTKYRGTYTLKLRPIGEQASQDFFAWDEEETEEEREDRFKRENKRSGIVLSDGRVHSDWNAHGTLGWRLSSSNTNLQNVPNKLRDIFSEEPGWCLVGCDQAQLELRMGAALARSESYLTAFRERRDAHMEFCLDIYGDEFRKATKDHQKALRRFVKELTYASEYRAEPETVHSVLTSSEDEDEKLLYPNITISQVAAMHRKWLARAKFDSWWEATDAEFARKGYLVDPVLGLRCDFLDGPGDKQLGNKLVNFLCQSGGAAIVHLATKRFLENMPKEWRGKVQLVNQGHDALVARVKKDHDGPQVIIRDKNEKIKETKWCLDPNCGCLPSRVGKFMEECFTFQIGSFPGIDVEYLGEMKIGNNWKEV